MIGCIISIPILPGTVCKVASAVYKSVALQGEKIEQETVFILAGLAAASLAVCAAVVVFRSNASASPEVFSSPINGGCYIAAPNQCRRHVDAFTINVNYAAGAKLVEFILHANGQPIYHFATDVSNPPIGNYTPSPVALDFAATCGETYYMNILGRDKADANL